MCGKIETTHEFDGYPFYFDAAPEPTNIIWEHRQITFEDQRTRSVIVSIIVVILLFIAFLAFFQLKKQTIANYNKYPPTTSCDDLYSIFKVSPKNPVGTNAKFSSSAESDKALIRDFGAGTGVYQCYCKQLQNEIGLGAMYEHPVCRMYTEDFFGGQTLSTIVSVSIVIINLVLRSCMLNLITWIGFHTESAQTNAIMTSIFVVQFFNTAILLILTNANTEIAGLSFIPLKGKYPDLNFEWYNDIGASFVITMITAALFPIIEFSIGFSQKLVFQFLDRGCSCNSQKTKKVTIQGYINLYSGPEYMMHFKYSGMMNVLFVTFMYGLAIPLLFPIALMAFTIQYVCEKLTITYFFRKPPMFDEKMNSGSIQIMKLAPLFMFFFGYWCMTNKQIFTNESYEIIRTIEAVQTGHTFWSMNFDQGFPLLIIGLFTTFCYVAKQMVFGILLKYKIIEEEQEDEVDEGLGTYWECLNDHDRREWMLDELNLQKNLGIQTIDDEAFYLLRDGKPGKKLMGTTPNYEMVSNPKYAEAF